MKTVDKISRIVSLMNSSKDLSNEEFNNNTEVLEVFKMIHGKEKLNSVLESKTDLHLNKFYTLSLQIENLAKGENISIDELKREICRIEEFYPRNWQLINLIEIAIGRKETDNAETIISQLPDDDKGPSQYVGHRKMLKHFAKQGNLVEFKKRIKFCKTGKFPRNEINEFKLRLIQAYSEQNGIEKGIELCKTKLFGDKFTSAAIMWKASNMTLNEIDKTLENYLILEQINPYIKAELYAKHFFDKRFLMISEEEFERVCDEINNVDEKTKIGDGKLRDYLFNNLGSSTMNESHIRECKKRIKSSFYKKELNYHLKNIKEGKYDG